MNIKKTEAATAGQRVADFPKKSKSMRKVIARPARKIQSRKFGILRSCQKSARRHNAPVLDALLARILARGAFGFDVDAELELARRLAALSERKEGATV